MFSKELPPVRCKKTVTKRLDEVRSPQPIKTDGSIAPKPISGNDYSACDKFNADEACQLIDKKSTIPNTELADDELSPDEIKKLMEKANICKDEGNKFVQKKQWDLAIERYTCAIEYFANEPIYFANRALCYLKEQDYEKVINDCNTAIELNPNYVKALQRRAAAYIGLKNLSKAQKDLVRVLELEPHNKESREELRKIENEMKKKQTVPLEIPNKTIATTEISKKTTDNGKGSEHKWKNDKILIEAIDKTPNLRSKKTLKTIRIHEVDSIDYTKFNLKMSSDDKLVNVKNKVGMELLNESDLCIPKSFLQFTAIWKRLSPSLKFQFLLKTYENFLEIFDEFLESDLFSEILTILAANVTRANNIEIANCLNHLTSVKRFSTLTIFMSGEDKKYVLTIINDLDDDQKDILKRKYELE